MTIAKKIDTIREQKIIYEIVFRNAGVALLFYDDKRVKNKEIEFNKIGGVPVSTGRYKYWQEGLYIDKYYPTFKKAVDAEYEKCRTR